MRTKTIGICNVQVPFVKGGAEILGESLQEQLIKRGHNVEMMRLPFKWYPKTEIVRSTLAWRLLDLTESNGRKIDLLICLKFPSYVVKHPNKVVWLAHQFRQAYDLLGTPYSDFTDSPEDRDIRQWIMDVDNKTIAESQRIFTISKNTANRLFKFNRLKADHLYPPPKHKGRYFCEDYGDYVLSVGRLESPKRTDLLIKAMQFTTSAAKCLIAGEGPLRKELEALSHKLRVSNKIKFVGWAEDKDLLKLFANAFAVFYAPIDEDYGYVTVEAFESKKPVITTYDSGGVLEFVEDDRNGSIASTRPQDIARMIDRLFTHKDLCRKFGLNGHDRVKDIKWNGVIKKLLCE